MKAPVPDSPALWRQRRREVALDADLYPYSCSPPEPLCPRDQEYRLCLIVRSHVNTVLFATWQRLGESEVMARQAKWDRGEVTNRGAATVGTMSLLF